MVILFSADSEYEICLLGFTDNNPAAKEQVEKLRQINNARRNKHERVATWLAAKRIEELVNHLPTIIRYQSLTYQHVGAMLLREQKLKLKQLLDILPLRITGLKSGGGSAIQISICNLKLPDSVSTPLNGWQQPEVCMGLSAWLVAVVGAKGTAHARSQSCHSKHWDFTLLV